MGSDVFISNKKFMLLPNGYLYVLLAKDSGQRNAICEFNLELVSEKTMKKEQKFCIIFSTQHNILKIL